MAQVLPTKLLNINMAVVSATAYYEADPSDVWFGYPYEWQVTLTVESQLHSSMATTTPLEYNVYDIKVGDWVATSSGGIAVRIKTINSVSGNILDCIVEDVDRYNISVDSTISGNGIGPDGPGYVFELDDTGLPKIGPLTPYRLDIAFQSDLQTRFQHRNPTSRFFSVYQPGHTFTLGQVVQPNKSAPGTFKLAEGGEFVDEIIGAVIEIGVPTSDWYNIKPFGTLSNELLLPPGGNYGDIWYLDPANPGSLTLTKPASNPKAVYLQLGNQKQGIIMNITSVATSATGGNVQELLVVPELNQVEFSIPNASEVLFMRINGIENDNFTFDPVSKILTFDPIVTGYGVDETDEVVFVYKS